MSDKSRYWGSKSPEVVKDTNGVFGIVAGLANEYGFAPEDVTGIVNNAPTPDTRTNFWIFAMYVKTPGS